MSDPYETQGPVRVGDHGDMNVDGEFRCPRCGEANLHHQAVTVFDRSEDDSEVLVTSVRHRVTEVSRQPSSVCPSTRRDAVTIGFSCEHCLDIEFVFHIVQHKGTTFVYWRGAEA